MSASLRSPRPWCRCAHLLARALLARYVSEGACLDEVWWENDYETRRNMVKDAEISLNWVGNCRCRNRGEGAQTGGPSHG